MSATRQQVFDALGRERQYQVQRWGVPGANGKYVDAEQPVTAYLVFMQTYLDKAMRRISVEPTDDGALIELRKVVALGVACFEQHGIPTRGLALVQNARDAEWVLPEQVW